MPTPARREISAIDASASGSAKAERAAAGISSGLRSASARLVGEENWSGGVGNLSGQPIRRSLQPLVPGSDDATRRALASEVGGSRRIQSRHPSLTRAQSLVVQGRPGYSP